MPMLRLDTRHDDDDDDDYDDDDDDDADAIFSASTCVQARYHQPCAEASLKRSLDRPSLPTLLLPPQLLLLPLMLNMSKTLIKPYHHYL